MQLKNICNKGKKYKKLSYFFFKPSNAFLKGITLVVTLHEGECKQKHQKLFSGHATSIF